MRTPLWGRNKKAVLLPDVCRCPLLLTPQKGTIKTVKVHEKYQAITWGSQIWKYLKTGNNILPKSCLLQP